MFEALLNPLKWFGTGVGTTAAKVASGQSLPEALANSDTVIALKNQARAWASRVVALYKRPVPSQYAAEKQKLLDRAKTIKVAVEKIFGKMPELQQQGLGAIPLIAVGVATVSAAAALMTKWSYDYLSLTKKLDEYDKMVASGTPPAVAKNLVNDLFNAASEQTTIGKAVSSIPLILGAGVAVYFLTQKKSGK
jgi:hypothetical protein